MELVDTAIEADEARRAAIGAFESARAEQKSLGSQVARAKGDENAARFGRTKAERDLEQARAEKAARDLDAHQRDE